MNLFNLDRHHALIDYAHNPAGYQAVGDFVKNWQGQRFGVVGGPGDRRNEDLIQLGQIAAQVFDRIIVKEDDDKRERPNGEAADLIVKGILQERPGAQYEVELDEVTAINHALDQVDNNGLVVVFPESVSRAIDLIKARNPIG
jgi:cyanophycin synthetase